VAREVFAVSDSISGAQARKNWDRRANSRFFKVFFRGYFGTEASKSDLGGCEVRTLFAEPPFMVRAK